MLNKILVLDIEWRPTKAYVWQPWGENIHPEKIIEHGGLLCVGLKWLGERDTTVLTEWELGHDGMVKEAHKYISEADAVITYNGDKYDLKKLEGEFLLAGLPPPPTITSIDCLKAVKKFGFFMNRLGFIAPFLKLGGKMEHEGMGLWVKVNDGNEKARERMKKYCKKDVVLLERLYLRIRPYIRNHPHVGTTKGMQCGACGSERLQSRGYYRTKMYKTQRIQCQSCGSWQQGKRTKHG